MLSLHVTRGPLVVLMGGLLLLGLLLMLGARDAAATHTCFPSNPDGDGDGLPNSCDPAAQIPDLDGDGFEDSLEIYVGTGPGSRCSFPADTDGNGSIGGNDVFKIFPAWLATPEDDLWVQRYDIDGNEVISAGDVFTIFDVWIQECPTWFSPSTVTKELRLGTTHFSEAQVWFGNVGNVLVESDPAVPGVPTCDEVKRAADHWSNTSDFQFSVGLTGNCSTTPDVRVIFRWSSLESFRTARVDPFSLSPFRECTVQSPCHFAEFAIVRLNKDFPK